MSSCDIVLSSFNALRQSVADWNEKLATIEIPKTQVRTPTVAALCKGARGYALCLELLEDVRRVLEIVEDCEL